MAIAIERRGTSRAGFQVQLRNVIRRWEGLGLLAVLAAAACLNFLQLSREGYANAYYAAAVKSMLGSWHNFFFVSFDPGGFVTVDKPPVGFWLQTASAKLLGFHGWSLLLPQAAAGVASVAVLFWLVRSRFGPVAGLLAAAALALSPISVATNRNNTIDSLLVFTSLLATWAVLRATERGSLRWLVAALALVAVGFNIKTLEAFLILPALVLVYFVAAPVGWRKRIAHLAVAGAVLVGVSLAWVTAVDLTPVSQRPYVGSSQHNSELELALGYNGLQRLLGQGGGAGPGNVSTAQRQAIQAEAAARTASSNQAAPTTAAQPQAGGPPLGGGPGGGGPGGTGENGPVGVFRLLDTQLGGQVGWLLATVLIGFVAAWQLGLRRRPDRRHQSLIVWGAWFLTCAVFFSKALFFHRYYLSMLAPSIAALFGIGALALWQAYRRGGLRGWLLPIALAATAGVQAYILHPYTGWSSWLTPIVAAPCLVAALLLAIARVPVRLRLPIGALAGVTALGFPALLVAPAVWAGNTVRNNAAASGVFGAGPALAGQAGFGGPGGPPPALTTARADGGQGAGQTQRDGFPAFAPSRGDGGAGGPQPGGDGGFGPGGGTSKALEQFLVKNQGSTKYLAAVSSAMSAEQLILDTGKPVMAMGGFTGSDPILTAQSFAALLKQGEVRFVELGGMGGPGGGRSAVTSWVQSSCTVVSASQIQGNAGTASSTVAAGAGGGQLYDCAPAAQ